MTREPTRFLTWCIVVIFVLLGLFVARTHRFERWAGHELQRAVPEARRSIPAPAKRALEETREHLPVYGSSSTWLARKSASVVYFGVVGIFVLALRRRRPASIQETILVTVLAGVGMSAIVEILEAPEELGDVLFDLGCGAAGGMIAGFIAWIWIARRKVQQS